MRTLTLLLKLSFMCYTSPLIHIRHYVCNTHTVTTHDTCTYLLCTHTNDCPYSQFLMPGLVCCHIHGDQVQNAGANYDKPFFNWLIEDFIRISQLFASNQTYARNAASSIAHVFPVSTYHILLISYTVNGVLMGGF